MEARTRPHGPSKGLNSEGSNLSRTPIARLRFTLNAAGDVERALHRPRGSAPDSWGRILWVVNREGRCESLIGGDSGHGRHVRETSRSQPPWRVEVAARRSPSRSLSIFLAREMDGWRARGTPRKAVPISC